MTEKDVKIKDKKTPDAKSGGNALSPKDLVKVSASAGKCEEKKTENKKKSSAPKKPKKVIMVAPPEIIDFASLIQIPSKAKKLEEVVHPEVKIEPNTTLPEMKAEISPKITE